MILSLIIASSCATVATSPISAGRTSTIELTSCKFPKLKEPARCGKLPVYENRAAQSGRMIALNIVVLPAQSSELKSDPAEIGEVATVAQEEAMIRESITT